jgi:hypothetical protein
MKKMFIIILILELINIIFSIVPIWKFENSAVDLLRDSKEYSYNICDRFMYKLSLKLQKTFTKNDDKISQKNTLYIDDNKIGDVPWEDIESFYKIDNVPYICPKGKYFLNIYKDNKLTQIIPQDFAENENWELLCYYQEWEKYMFIAFVNSHPIVYALKLDGTNTFQKVSNFDDRLYDFKWVTDAINKNDYPMKAITLKDNMITLKGLYFTIVGNDNSIKVVEKKEKQITKMLTNSNSYYNLNNDNFYFMTYNSVSDLITGYYNKKSTIEFDNIDQVDPVVNNLSPLEFFDDVEIKFLKFIRNTKYLYYEIVNKGNNATYHGIIDIEFNKVIFNTDEEIVEFKPYSNNAMLAITKNSVYKICTIKNNDDTCKDECSSGKLVLDTLKPNQCNSENKCDNCILIPNEICIEECDENLFTKNGKQCGLCRDLNKEKPYKLVNSEGCFSKSELPDNTIVINEKLFLVKCKENYVLEGGKCIISCNDLCETCDDFSEDIKDQKCTSCKNIKHVLQEGNCIDKCSNGFYLDEKKCLKCSKKCETCTKGPENGNDNCLTCNQNSENKYLFNDEKKSTCVEECPTGTTLEKINNTCLYQNNTDIEPQKKNLTVNWVLWIVIFIFIIILLIILIIYFKKTKNQVTSEDIEKNNQIN